MKTYINLFKTQSRWLCAIAIGAVIAVGLASCGGGKKNAGGGGGDADLNDIKEAAGAVAEAAKSVSGAVKGSGKNYTLSKDSDFEYDLTKIDGTDYVVITDVNLPSGFKKAEKVGNETQLVDTLTVKVPEKIEGYTVGVIGQQAFASARWGRHITSITLPDTVIEIGLSGFSDSPISSIKLPKNLKKLGNGAFSGCENLSGTLVIPNGITEIPNSCFGGGFGSDGPAITEVTIPDSVTAIGEDAFWKCKQLTTVKLPSHPIKYGNDAFSGCSKLSLATRKAIQDSGYTGEF